MNYLKSTFIKQKIKSNIFPIIIASIFLIFGIFMIWISVLVRDERRAWTIATTSSSWFELFERMRADYDPQGSPFLWHIILYLFSHFISKSIMIMKVLHLLIATSSIFLFIKYSPFNNIIKLLFIFGYYPFFEYSIIARRYAIGILFIFIFLVLYRDKYKNLIPISIVLFLMGQSNIYAFIISVALFVFLFFEFSMDRKTIEKRVKHKFVFLIFTFILEIILVIIQLGDQLIANKYGPSVITIFNDINLKEILFNKFPRVIISAYLPIPKLTLNFWDSNLIYDLISNQNFLKILVSLFLLIIPIFLIKKRAIFLYSLSTFIVLFIPLFIYMGGLRHYGFIFLVFIVCLWISSISKNDRYLINFKIIDKIVKIYLVTILIIAIFGSGIAVYYNVKYSFSNARYINQYFREKSDIGNAVITVKNLEDAMMISSHIDKPVYCLQCAQNIYCLPSKVNTPIPNITKENSSNEELLQTASSFKGLYIYAITTEEIIDEELLNKYYFVEVPIQFDKGKEDYHLYKYNLYESFNLNSLMSTESFKNCNLKNSEISIDSEIILNNNGHTLAICEIPFNLEKNKKYLIVFDAKKEGSLNNFLFLDFYSKNLDIQELEFQINPDILENDKKQFIHVFDVGEISGKEKFYFRIFTYSKGKIIIDNLKIFKEN